MDAYNAEFGLPATSSEPSLPLANNFWPGPDGVVDAIGQQTQFGDLDDVLMMTIKAPNEPFRGRLDLVDGNPITGYDHRRIRICRSHLVGQN